MEIPEYKRCINGHLMYDDEAYCPTCGVYFYGPHIRGYCPDCRRTFSDITYCIYHGKKLEEPKP